MVYYMNELHLLIGDEFYMKIIVCDDTASERTALCVLIEKYFNDINCPFELLVYESADALAKNFESLKAQDVKLAFLDIYMPGLSGVDMAKIIRETDKEMVIVFTTSSPDHGLDGYSVKALQYLLKPVGYAELKDTLDDCMAIFADSLQYIEVIAERVAVKIPLKDITFIEIHAHYGLIHTTKDIIKCRLTLDEVEQKLSGKNFLRTQRSYIVNMRFIKSVEDNDFILTSGEAIPIRKNDKLKVKQAYMDYIFAQTREAKYSGSH